MLIVANLLCFILSLFDVIIKLHVVNEILFNDFLIKSESGFAECPLQNLPCSVSLWCICRDNVEV